MNRESFQPSAPHNPEEEPHSKDALLADQETLAIPRQDYTDADIENIGKNLNLKEMWEEKIRDLESAIEKASHSGYEKKDDIVQKLKEDLEAYMKLRDLSNSNN